MGGLEDILVFPRTTLRILLTGVLMLRVIIQCYPELMLLD